ncbi:hypothetical protein TRFO_02349 [Tritrichomonas foetus]|uniref:Uncharacterized protein n=1 Tax=Tritrichomonas foetus TaxID=1144522 RepID=A0A1J4J8V0_9EUKA|nr:hypothetical protein TRFO_02349 [Tritrichomonas foetus]|eukprot:OHS93829.1 hypothetical protein TRFO_02349 [Tritrichomonas foetus]
MMESLSTQSLYKLARDDCIDYVLEATPELVNDIKKTEDTLNAVTVLLTLSAIFAEKNEIGAASDIANFALTVAAPYPPKILGLLNAFALCFPEKNQSISMEYFFSRLISISGDKDHLLRKKLIRFAENNHHNHAFIQKNYILLYRECLLSKKPFDFLTDEVSHNFARHLWRMAQKSGDSHTGNAIFLRSIMAASLQGRNNSDSANAARLLFEAIFDTKPDEVDFNILNHPFYRYANFFTKALVSKNVDSYKRIGFCYEKLLFQDSEIAMMSDMIFKKYFLTVD